MPTGTPMNPPGPPDVKRFQLVQPWGPDKTVQHTLLSQHRTAGEAFAEIDRLAADMQRTGARLTASSWGGDGGWALGLPSESALMRSANVMVGILQRVSPDMERRM